jgi:hypothetical protein
MMGWVGDVTAHVNANSDLGVSAWSAQFGHPLGTIGWSALVEGRAQLTASTAGLLADPGYHELVHRAADWVVAPPQDFLRGFMHGGPGEDGPPPLGAVAVMTTAVAAGGKYAEAFAWGAEIAQYTESISGMPVALLADAYGTFGQMTWISVAADAAAADAADAAINTDPGYLQRLGAVGDLFVPASGHRSQLVRIA